MILNAHQSGSTLTQLVYRTASPVADDQDLLRLAREDGSGSPAWDVLVKRYGGLVWTTCRRQSFCANEADDATQLTFFLLFRTLSDPSSPPIRSLGGWLTRVANRVACRVRKRGDRERTRRIIPDELHHPDTATDAQAERQDTDRVLVEELSRLPERYQTAIFETKFNGLTAAVAAHRLGTQETTLRKWVERGLKQLEARLRRRGVSSVSAALLLGCLTTSASAVESDHWQDGVRTESVAHLDPALTSVSQLVGCHVAMKVGVLASVLAVAAVVAFGAVLMGAPALTTPNTPVERNEQGPPIPIEKQAPIRVENFSLKLWRAVAGENRNQFISEILPHVGAIPTAQDTYVWEVALDRPAPVLLLQVRPDRDVVLCEPTDPRAPASEFKEFRYPPIERHGEERLTESGNQAFVLVVLKRPESYADFLARLGGKLPWTRVKGEGLWYSEGNATAKEIRPIGGPLNPRNDATAEPLNELCTLLAKQSNVAAVRGFGLTVRRQQPKR